jgi:uncharacterized damage-inducible protein DinB
MARSILERLFEHNNWANRRIIQACSALSDDQLDAEPRSVTKGSIRLTLTHLVSSQQGYLSLLTLPLEARQRTPLAFTELEESAIRSGEGLLALASDESELKRKPRLRTTDGYFVEPWVVMVQVINHATEHREQICSMLTALGVLPPELDGWALGEDTRALTRISS